MTLELAEPRQRTLRDRWWMRSRPGPELSELTLYQLDLNLGRAGSGEQDESDIYQVISTATELTVRDAGVRPRLAILGARLGERALPVLDRLLEANPPCAGIAVFEAWRRIGTDAAIGRLSKCSGDRRPGQVATTLVRVLDAPTRHVT